MKKAFNVHINKDFPQLLDSRVLVGCSGGLDSMVLTRLLHGMGVEIGLAHCNFSLRGKESDEDESFVVDRATAMEIPVYTQRFETISFAKDHRVSTQMAARELRYGWFEEIRRDFKYDFIATAHHADDNLETFFINLSRGTGLKGLVGIPSKNNNIVRPLLAFSREQLLTFAKSENIPWREDSSNQSKDYLRNEIRHDLIPGFKNISKNWQQTFQATQDHLKASHALLDDYLSLVIKLVLEQRKEGYAILIDKLKELPNHQFLMYELLSDFGFTAWEDVVDLLEAQSGKQIFSKTHRLIKDRDVILLTEHQEESQNFVKIITKSETQLMHPLRMSFIPIDKMGYADNNTIYVDSDQLVYPLVLRKWEEGDRFQPFGMKGKKKLSKYFKDEKLSLAAKEAVWVLTSKDRIVWVVGYRMDERFKVTTDTNNIVKIAVKKDDEKDSITS